MNYLKVYCNLIRKAENRIPPEGYTEKHHIFPKSIFGKNNRIVVLTAREHYIAHALLEKICIQRYGLKDKRTIKMTYAHTSMVAVNGNNERYYNSYLYENAKIRRSENMKGIGNPNYGVTYSEERKRKISEQSLGRKLTERARENIRKAKLGNKNPFYGKTHSQEAKVKMSEDRAGEKNSFYGRTHSDETKRILAEKNSENMKGMLWWNNGQIQKRSKECPGDGWYSGRLKIEKTNF